MHRPRRATRSSSTGTYAVTALTAALPNANYIAATLGRPPVRYAASLINARARAPTAPLVLDAGIYHPSPRTLLRHRGLGLRHFGATASPPATRRSRSTRVPRERRADGVDDPPVVR
jgi:hypothetical protein